MDGKIKWIMQTKVAKAIFISWATFMRVHAAQASAAMRDMEGKSPVIRGARHHLPVGGRRYIHRHMLHITLLLS